jgi:hypothetical protein
MHRDQHEGHALLRHFDFPVRMQHKTILCAFAPRRGGIGWIASTGFGGALFPGCGRYNSKGRYNAKDRVWNRAAEYLRALVAVRYARSPAL